MTDQTYNDAALEVIGLNVATLFNSLIANGMGRDEALQVVIAWVVAMTPEPN